MKILEILETLDKIHKEKLEWFINHKGLEVNWSETTPGNNGFKDKVFLFSTPKGIFKPHGSDYVLSIRVMMSSHYPDQKVIFREDGSWSFRYYREEIANKEPDSLFTNRGLIKCMKDNIPIGVAIQTSGKTNVKYKILGIANVSDYKDGFFQINGYSNDGSVNNESFYGVFSKNLDEINLEPFDPSSNKDARDKVLKQIVLRQGQKKFREGLLKIYNSTCLISRCRIPSVLEAAHITPYLGPHTNDFSNGLILRSDIHVLWDLGLIAIEPTELRVFINPVLEGSEYGIYNNSVIKNLINLDYTPSFKALESQWNLFLNKVKNIN